MTAKQKYERDKQIHELFNSGVKTSIIAKQFNVTTQTVRNIGNNKLKPDDMITECIVLKEWHNSSGEYRHKVNKVSELTGLDKCQVRYIIKKNLPFELS